MVLTGLASVAGGVLAAVNSGTEERIKSQQLEFVKGPAIHSIMSGALNNPVEDYFTVVENETEHAFFIGRFTDNGNIVAFEEWGKGFGGDIGVMIGYNLSTDTLHRISVTIHSETPGLGARAKSDPEFAAQFSGIKLADSIKVAKDGGQIDAISGATITSRAVCEAVEQSMRTYNTLKPRINAQVQERIKQE